MPEGKQYTNPTPNPNGVSGWCYLDDVRLRRVHVCAHNPCTVRNEDSHGNVKANKYGLTGPPDDHVRVYLHPPPLSPPPPSVSDEPPLLVPIEVSLPTPPPPPIEVLSLIHI